MPHSPEDKTYSDPRPPHSGPLMPLNAPRNRAILSRHFAANRRQRRCQWPDGEMVEIHLKDELVTGRPPRISGLCGWRKSAIYCALI